MDPLIIEITNQMIDGTKLFVSRKHQKASAQINSHQANELSSVDELPGKIKDQYSETINVVLYSTEAHAEDI